MSTKRTTLATAASTPDAAITIHDKDDDDEEFQSIKHYLDELHQFDIKFLRIRLLNNVIFFVSSCFYVAMDVVPYSGLEPDPTFDDDHLFEDNKVLNQWINQYAILYFVASFLFVWTGALDLYLVYLGRHHSPQDVEEQIINRHEARKLRRKRNQRQQNNDVTMMGFVISIRNDNDDDDASPQAIEESKEAMNGDVVGIIPAAAAEQHPKSRSIYERLDKATRQSFRSCPSSVVLVSWALLVGGLFGVASSVFVLHNLIPSDILNAISVHLFFIQACMMYHARLVGTNDDSQQGNDDDDHVNSTDNDDDDKDRIICVSKWLLIVGDICFGTGALIDVIWAYVYIFSEAYFQQAIMTLISGLLWLLSSIAYGIVTVWDYRTLLQDIQSEQLSLTEEFAAKTRSSITTHSSTCMQSASSLLSK